MALLVGCSGGSGSAQDGTIKFTSGKAVPVYGKAGKGIDAAKAESAVVDAYRSQVETGTAAAVTVPTTTKQPTVSNAEVDRMIADGGRVMDFYAPYDGSHGPEYRLWVARRTAEHLRWRWLAQLDPPSADELVSAWRDAEETAVAFGIEHLRSWHPRADVSTIVPLLDEPVTSFQQSAIVTEHGIAELWGYDQQAQCRHIIRDAAHPQVRDELWEEAAHLGLA